MLGHVVRDKNTFYPVQRHVRHEKNEGSWKNKINNHTGVTKFLRGSPLRLRQQSYNIFHYVKKVTRGLPKKSVK
jgi:hypothetical protein